MELVCDLILTNLDTGKITTISCFDRLIFDDNYEQKNITIFSYGLVTYIKNIEKFKFIFKYRIIPDEDEDEPTMVKNSDD